MQFHAQKWVLKGEEEVITFRLNRLIVPRQCAGLIIVCRASNDAVEIIKTLLERQITFQAAEIPLPENPGGVSRGFQVSRQDDFARVHSIFDDF